MLMAMNEQSQTVLEPRCDIAMLSATRRSLTGVPVSFRLERRRSADGLENSFKQLQFTSPTDWDATASLILSIFHVCEEKDDVHGVGSSATSVW